MSEPADLGATETTGTSDSSDAKRKILEMVSAGQINVDEATRLLEALKEAPEPGRGRSGFVTKEVRRTVNDDVDSGPVERVRVVGTFRALRILGDESVQGAIGEGEFQKVRQEDGTLIFEESQDEDKEGSFMLFGPRNLRGSHFEDDDDEEGFGFRKEKRAKRVRFSGTINGRQFRFGEGGPPVLRIRMNPDLPLEIDMTAGSAKVNGVHGPITANLTAGSGRFEDIRSPIKIGLDAGSVNVQGLFNEGDSEIRCTAGKVRVELDRSSNVSIKASATLGRIALPDDGERDSEWQGVGTGRRQSKVGDGRASLDIEATTGSVVVELA